MTHEILVSDAPCVSAIMLMPLLPNAPQNLPAMPGTCFMFSPTIAMVERLYSTVISLMLPNAISWANSSLNTRWETAASGVLTPMDVLFSDEAWETKNTLMPFCAKVRKMRWFTPIIPTIPSPCMVMSAVSLMEEIPLIILPSSFDRLFNISVPFDEGLKLLRTLMGMFLW